MNLNSVTIFGQVSGGNGPASLTFLIIFIVCFSAALVALGYLFINLMVSEARELATETVGETLPEAKPAKTKRQKPLAETAAQEVKTVAPTAAIKPAEEQKEEQKAAQKTAPVEEQKSAPAEESSADEENEDDFEEIVPEEDLESYRSGRLTYDKSFLAKLIQSGDGVKSWYNQIKNDLKSYERVRDRMSWRRETFKVGKSTVARLAIKGKTLCLYLAVDPEKYKNSDYKVDDVSDVTAFADTPCVYRVRSDQRLGYAFELIEDAMTAVGTEKGTSPATEYYLPYENLSQLLDKGLVKRIIRN